MRSRLIASLRLVVWTGGLVVSARLLLAAGSETLSVPVTSFDDLSVWVSDTPPADMVIAILRVAALAAVAYLLAATVLTVVARLVAVRPLVAAAEVLSPAIVRRLATGGSGIGLVVGGAVAGLPAPDLPFGATSDPVAVTATPAGPESPFAAPTATMSRLPTPTATMTPIGARDPLASPTAALPTRAIDPTAAPAAPIDPTVAPGASGAAAPEATMTRIDGPAPPSATMTRLPGRADAPPAAATPAAATPVAHAPTAPTAPAPAAPEVDPTLWIVEHGDSLWSIAEEVATSADGSPAAERTVTRYWQRLVAANRANLVDPHNPDLIVPGQQLVLPAPDS